MDTSSGTNPKRTLWIAFVVGAVVHALLLGLSLVGNLDMAAVLLLVFALPGALVDISSEMIHPSQTGGFVLAFVGTVVNGGAYALGAWGVLKIRARMRNGS